MIALDPWILISVGLLAGLLGAMMGVGGGIFIVPALTLIFHLPIQTAIGCSLITIVAGSITATTIYTRKGITNIKLGILLQTASIPGSIIGALAAASVSPALLNLFFAVLLVYCAFVMFPWKPSLKTVQQPPVALPRTQERADDTESWAHSVYFDTTTNVKMAYTFKRPLTGMAASLFAGFVSSLLGIGGGIINVPATNIIMGVPIKAAIATSSFIIMVTAATGALTFYYQGLIDPFVAATLVIGAVIGSRIGSQLMQKARGDLLYAVFAGLLVATAVLMFLKSANGI